MVLLIKSTSLAGVGTQVVDVCRRALLGLTEATSLRKSIRRSLIVIAVSIYRRQSAIYRYQTACQPILAGGAEKSHSNHYDTVVRDSLPPSFRWFRVSARETLDTAGRVRKLSRTTV
jgi:hypothetical protein